eukprot:1734498-Amphidinium_carterae.1
MKSMLVFGVLYLSADKSRARGSKEWLAALLVGCEHVAMATPSPWPHRDNTVSQRAYPTYTAFDTVDSE